MLAVDPTPVNVLRYRTEVAEALARWHRRDASIQHTASLKCKNGTPVYTPRERDFELDLSKRVYLDDVAAARVTHGLPTGE